MTNNSLIWDMIYHPRLISIYSYFHNITFVLTTILISFSIFVILKKSTPAVSYYKYILVNMMAWVYILDLFYFLWKPINLLPYYMIYSNGLFQYLPREALIYLNYLFGFIVYMNNHAVSLALNYRILQLFFDTKFYTWINNGVYFMRYAIISFVVISLYWSIPFIIALPINPYNPEENLKNVISSEPIIAQLLILEPTTIGCDMQDGCEPLETLVKIDIVSFSSFVIIMAVIIFILYYKKDRELSKTLAFEQNYKLNQMLFRALTIQLAMIVFLFFMPIAFIIVLCFLRFNSANFYAQLALFPILLYPIIDVIVLLYFIKPYRIYVKGLFLKIGYKLALVKIKTSVTEPPVQFTVNSSKVNVPPPLIPTG